MLELIGGGMQLAGALLGRKSAKEANEINRQNALDNIRLQQEFAQNAIQWKVKDAEKAGLHPLAALGANTMSFSPVSVGATGADPLASTLTSMGQDVTRAGAAYASRDKRADAAQTVAAGQELTANKLRLENMDLQNKILRSKLVTMNQPATPPGVEFPVAEKSKPEERPPLMALGRRWDTNPNTSPMKAWEDQYGDEGPVAWAMPLVIGANDAIYNLNKKYNPDSWRSGFVSTHTNAVQKWRDARDWFKSIPSRYFKMSY